MAAQLTPMQKRCVELIMQRMQQYLDARFIHARRINPKVEQVWQDISWQQMTNLRKTLEGDKAFGPERVNVAELLLSDNRKRIADLYMTKSQNCLIGEIVEVRESDGHRTHSAMEIHDMRTLFRALDPAVESIVALVQTFIWWDLEDGTDLARFDKHHHTVLALQENGIHPEAAAWYKEKLHSQRDVTVDDAILYDLRQMAFSRDLLRARRSNEKAHQIIVAHESAKKDNTDAVIEALGSQLTLRDNLQRGMALNAQLAEQLSKAIHCTPEEVTPERAVGFLEGAIATNRKRLTASLLGAGGGTPYSYKAKQLEEVEVIFKQVAGDRQVDPVPVDPPTST